MATASGARLIQSLQRMDSLLRAIAVAPAAGARLSELAAATGLHKNTVFSLLKTMVALGYCTQCRHGRGYRLGPRSFELARLAEREMDVIGLARPLMLRLVHQFRESLSLAVPGPTAGIVVATVEGSYGVRGTRFQGHGAPYNASALGKALLAAMPAEERRELLARLSFDRFTSRTIVTAAELAADCDKAALRGYALSVAEEEVGANAVAVGLRARGGEVLGALAVWGPSVRLTRQRLAQMGERLAAETAGLLPGLAG
jgi:IclR family acetate operon transcriptional repressor